MPGYDRADGHAGLLPDVRRDGRARQGSRTTTLRVELRLPWSASCSRICSRGVDPLRQRVELNWAAARAAGPQPPGPPVGWQIVGVFQTINNSEHGDVSEPEVVLPFWQLPSLDAAIAVRTAGNPASVRKDVAAATRSIPICRS